MTKTDTSSGPVEPVTEPQPGRLARLMRLHIHLGRFCVRQLRDNNALAMSSALSFRTIFAMVPAIVLAVLALKSFGFLDEDQQLLQQFLDNSGISDIAVELPTDERRPWRGRRPTTASDQATAPAPAASSAPAGASARARATGEPREISLGHVIERQVRRISRKLTLGSLGPVGGALLIWTALTLLTTMERSLNRIFQAPRGRPLGRRILLYWSVVTLVPLLLVVAIYAEQVISETFGHVPVLRWLMAAVGVAESLLVSTFVVAAVYILMPNTRVRFRAALAGAAAAVPMWFCARWGFGVYLARVAVTSLYGAMGLLPLFLIWLNLSWWIFLFGAQLAHALDHLGHIQSMEQAGELALGPLDLLAAALAVAGPYQAGQGATRRTAICRQLGLPAPLVHRLLDQLVAASVICPVEAGREPAYVLARPAEGIPILQIMDLVAAGGAADAPRQFDEPLAAAVAHVQQIAHDQMGKLTLADAAAASRDAG